VIIAGERSKHGRRSARAYAAQVDNAPPSDLEVYAFDPSEAAEAIIASYPDAPPITVGGDAAYYVPSADSVTLPSRDLFPDSRRWYAVAFHELTHSAGHAKRCGGLIPATFGSDPYAREELVAEIGAAMLGASCSLGVEIEASAAYVANWREVLSEDPRLIVSAAAEAQRRADHIRGVSFATEDAKQEGDAAHAIAA
jgi:putative DNA primase/helicase